MGLGALSLRTTALWGLTLLLLLAGAGPALAQEAEPVDATAGDIDEETDIESTPGDRAGGPRLQMPAPPRAGAGPRARGIALDPEGHSRLHLRLDLGAGFDTNPYAVPFDFQTEQLPSDIVTRIRPGLELIYPGSLLAFDGGLYVDYGFLPDVFGGGQNAQWLLYQAAARGSLEVNREGMFSFAAQNLFSTNNDAGVVALGTIFNRLDNMLRLGVGFRPGGGTLRVRLAYNFGFEKWFDPAFGIFGEQASPLIREGGFDQMFHGASLRADYRFLPKTGVFARVNAGWNTFPFDQNNINPDSFPVGVHVGLMGQLTPKLAGLASLGYENPLIVDTLPDGNVGITTGTVIGAVGQAELRWTITPTSRLGAGIKRDFRPAPLYQFLTNNRVYARFDQAIGAKFVLGLFVGYSLLQFGDEQQVVIDGQARDITDTTGTDRFDGHLDVGARLSYYMFDWLSFGLANNLDWRHTNANDAASGANLSFLANETLLLASLHY